MEMEWINSRDKVPKENETVLITHDRAGCPIVYVACYNRGIFNLGLGRGSVGGAVWWMPMPEPHYKGKHEKH